MHTAYLVLTLIAIAFDGFSGVSALLHFAPIIPPMQRAGVPLSWLRFPIGTLKTLGALGLIAGLWLPAIGIAARPGLPSSLSARCTPTYWPTTFPVSSLSPDSCSPLTAQPSRSP